MRPALHETVLGAPQLLFRRLPGDTPPQVTGPATLIAQQLVDLGDERDSLLPGARRHHLTPAVVRQDKEREVGITPLAAKLGQGGPNLLKIELKLARPTLVLLLQAGAQVLFIRRHFTRHLCLPSVVSPIFSEADTRDQQKDDESGRVDDGAKTES